ncbi:MAG: zinc ribbon domain-containing protein [Candidatus Marinimicrobia bacterium]|nr:zinc ribbon domain-containing protein [Candidatus Neomarinimicrobiota bacterium]MCF7851199.1 zinc ribbon domain-containing protein [Candidatus Neomarinimicrobiota bacterium]MCF7904143.1 zinc ribbon domain-containing protein [Candidatus Neomarinimicrobiota bacterium]
MTYLGIIMGLAFLAWAVLPLFQKDTTWVSMMMDYQELEDEKKRVYGNIADLEFDYAMGRLSEKDFNVIRQDFLKEAGRVIKKLDEQDTSSIMKQIERDVDNLGGKKGKKKANRKGHDSKCPNCQTVNDPAAKFCMSCGESLK